MLKTNMASFKPRYPSIQYIPANSVKTEPTLTPIAFIYPNSCALAISLVSGFWDNITVYDKQ